MKAFHKSLRQSFKTENMFARLSVQIQFMNTQDLILLVQEIFFLVGLLNCGSCCLLALKQLIDYRYYPLSNLVSTYLSVYTIVIRGGVHGDCDIISSTIVFYISFIVEAFRYSIFHLIVAFSCSSRGSDCNWHASSASFPCHSEYSYFDLLTHCI